MPAVPQPQNREIYRKILATASNIVQSTSSEYTKSRVSFTTDSLEILPEDLLQLHRPMSILPILLNDGIPAETAQRLAKLHMQFSEGLSKRIETSFCETWSQLCTIGCQSAETSQVELYKQLVHTYKALYTRHVQIWVDKIREQARSRLVKARKATDHKGGGKAGSKLDNVQCKFNQLYLPVLETYFKRNPKPSKADKLYLAEKSGMSYKQIHVWFQNKRSRTRNADSLCCGRKDNTSSNGISESRNLKSKVASSSLSSPQFLTNKAPKYAFPETYPPCILFREDPFPCRSGDFSCFAQPHWARRPVSQLQSCQSSYNVDNLVCALEKLQIDGPDCAPLQEERKCRKDCLQSPGCKRVEDFIPPYMVRPLRAPVASGIRTFTGDTMCQLDRILGDNSNSLHKTVRVPADSISSQGAVKKVEQCPAQALYQSHHEQETALQPGLEGHIIPIMSCTDQLAKARKSVKNWRIPHRLPTLTASGSRDNCIHLALQSAPEAPEPPTSHPFSASFESLPSLTYSSGRSSASTCSPSPTLSFAILSDDGCLPLSDASDYQAKESLLKPPPPRSLTGEFPLSSNTSSISFDFTKLLRGQVLGLDLPVYPSYSESFDLLSQGLQSSPDFPPPSLTFNLPPLTA